MHRLLGAVVALSAVSLVGCEAGPSAFQRDAGDDPLPDTADVSSLPPVPIAAEVETLAAPDTDTFEVAVGGVTSIVEVSTADPGLPPDSGVTADSLAEPLARFPRPEHVRGLYLNAWASGSSKRSAELIELAQRTEVNTFVIDIKDATGYVSHPTHVPMAREVGATEEVRIRDLPGLLDRLEAAGIYPIARIVVVKDPLVSAARPELAVQDTAGGVWVDSKGIVWLNPYDRRVWEYHVAIAREVAELGFPEIQWDYVRFPDASPSDHARSVYPGEAGQPKPEAIRAFLAYGREALADLDVQLTADVFGVTTSASRDVGIGQVWEAFIDVVDVALPMVYPSHYWSGSFQFDTPNAYPYEIVRAALRDALRRSAAVEGAGVTRPWLQDFTLGPPRYEAPEVRAQIQATYDAGIREWILWNPGSRYTVEALEPVDGFAEEPLIRVGAQVVPVSRRFELVERLPSGDVAPDSASAVDSLAVRVETDSAAVGNRR